MSELNSLYMRVTLTENSLNAFRQSLATAPRQYQDWLPWLATRQFYGTITAQEIEEIEPPDAAQQAAITQMFTSALGQESPASPSQNHPLTVAEYLSFALGSVGVLMSGATRASYDPVAHTWTLAIVEFAENYKDYIQELAILRAVERYKDLPGDDFILIFPYLWGGDPDAYLVIEQGASRFVDEAPQSAIDEASRYLEQILRETHPDIDNL